MNEEVWISTYTGHPFKPFKKGEVIRIEDIAHSLSLICRFGGHCRVHYSVAEHSCLTEEIVHHLGGTQQDRLAALLHDASEAFLGDWTSPVKSILPGWLIDRDDKLQGRLFLALGVSSYDAYLVAKADGLAKAIEARDLMASTFGWSLPEIPHMLSCISKERPWTNHYAKLTFLHQYDLLTKNSI